MDINFCGQVFRIYDPEAATGAAATADIDPVQKMANIVLGEYAQLTRMGRDARLVTEGRCGHCSYCKAEPDEHCRTNSGKLASQLHKDRRLNAAADRHAEKRARP